MRLANGYTTFTTFWEDFTIADRFGANAVIDTYERAFKEWKYDYKYLTELVVVLNLKIWEWYQINEDLAQVYDTLWDKAAIYAEDHLKGDELSYYFNVTD